MNYYFLKYLLLCVLLVTGSLSCEAQDTRQQQWAGRSIVVNLLADKVYKHEAKFTLPIPELSSGLDVDFLLHTHGTRLWQQLRHYPVIGLGATYINYGIDSVYGSYFGLYPNVEIPVVSGGQLRWTVRAGYGAGYVSRKFMRTAPVDTINVAIGSHINGFGIVVTDLHYFINKHWEVQGGLHLTHISDASVRKPNLGINTWGVNFGIAYSPVTSRPERIISEAEPLTSRWLIQARLSTAMVSSYTPGGPLYPVYLASGFASRRWLGKNKLFAGLDYSYHQNIYSFLVNNELATGRERQNAWKSAVFAGNEFLFGRMGVFGQIGMYLKQAYVRTDFCYEKAGINYYLVQKEKGTLKEFFLTASVKTHRTVAEMGEIGLGMGF